MAAINIWLAGAALLTLALIPCGIVCLKSGLIDALVAVELASAITVLTIVALAEGAGRPAWFDLALSMALLSFPSSLVFAEFLEQWL